MNDESTCIDEGMTVTFQSGEIWRIYILLISNYMGVPYLEADCNSVIRWLVRWFLLIG